MSWPVNASYGVQLGFGSEGSVIYQANSSKSERLKFAKEREPVLKFHEVVDKRIVFQEDQVPDDTELDLHLDSEDSEDQKLEEELATSFVPKDMIKELGNEAQHFESKDVYDPTIGSLLSSGKLKTYGDTFVRVVAYAGGPSGSDLQFVIIGVHRTTGKLAPLSQLKILFPAPIRQILFCEPSESLGPIAGRFFLVRSELIVYIMKLEPSKNGATRLKLLDEVSIGGKIADMSFSCWDPNCFVVQGLKGDCHFWSLNLLRQVPLSKLDDISVDTQNPGELSNFHLVRWGNRYDSVVLVDRSMLQIVNTETLQRKVVLVLNSYSSIRYFQKVSDKHSILLTSKEIMLLENKNDVADPSFTRLLSWKHYLDAEDPSLKFQLSNLTHLNGGSALYHCAIYSNYNRLVLTVQFWLKDGVFRCLSDPPLTSTSTVCKDLALVPFLALDLSVLLKKEPYDCIRDENVRSADEEGFLMLFEMTSRLGVNVHLFSTVEQAVSDSSVVVGADEETNGVRLLRESYELKPEFRHFLSAVKFCDSQPDDQVPFSQTDQVQEVAHRIGSYLYSLKETGVHTTTNLGLAIDILRGITDIEELDSMVEQLVSRFTNEGFEFQITPIGTKDEQFDTRAPVRSAYELLAGLYSRQEGTVVQLAVQLAFSNITCRLKEAAASLRTLSELVSLKFPEDVQAILRKWGEKDATEALDVDPGLGTQARQDFPMSAPQLPSVRVSQPSRTHTDSQSQGSSQPLLDTQVVRGVFGSRNDALKKKKKKRIRGFG